MNNCLFLDRDGTIIEYGDGYNFKPEKIRLIRGADKLISAFNRAGYKVIFITNQGGIGKGLYTEDDVFKIHAKINDLLAESGGHADDLFYCPHDPNGIGKYRAVCSCRKPGGLLLQKAIEKYNADVKNSLFLGDNITDKQCAESVGVRFYPLSFRHVITTSHGFRSEIRAYTDETIERILSFALHVQQV